MITVKIRLAFYFFTTCITAVLLKRSIQHFFISLPKIFSPKFAKHHHHKIKVVLSIQVLKNDLSFLSPRVIFVF